MAGENPQNIQALELLKESKEYMLIVKRNRKKLGEQHTANWVTIANCEPVERLLDALAQSVSNYNPKAKDNKRKIRKWLREDLFHDELNELLQQRQI